MADKKGLMYLERATHNILVRGQPQHFVCVYTFCEGWRGLNYGQFQMDIRIVPLFKILKSYYPEHNQIYRKVLQ